MSIQDIKKLREQLGCGLKEARDAIQRYGTFEKAWEALKPDTPATNDPYANAVADRERWHNKSSTYRAGLQRIINSPHVSEDVRDMADKALRAGDDL